MRVGGAGGRKRYHEVPDKNFYSHISDALQYAFVHIRGGLVDPTVKPVVDTNVRNVIKADISAWT